MKTVEMKLANESENHGKWHHYHDKALFVKNLGTLLSQTREQIVGCDYDKRGDMEIVIVRYKGDNKKEVNVTMDSYMSIVRDVSKYA